MITDIEVFKQLSSTEIELIKTIEKRIKFESLSNERAVELISEYDNFIISLRKYWM